MNPPPPRYREAETAVSFVQPASRGASTPLCGAVLAPAGPGSLFQKLSRSVKICQAEKRAAAGGEYMNGSIAAAEKHSNAPWSTLNGTGLSLLSAMSLSSGAAGGNLSFPVVPLGGGYCLRNLPLPLTLGHAVPKASEDRSGPHSGRLRWSLWVAGRWPSLSQDNRG